MTSLSRITSTATAFVASFALVALTIVAPVSAGQKAAPAKTPPLTMKLRDRLAKAGKSAREAAKAPARIRDISGRAAASGRSAAVAQSPEAKPGSAGSKGEPWTVASPRRASLPDEKGTFFVGRNGTGLGDIFEDEPNDSVAHILDDVPVNVVGEVSFETDIDFFAFTAEGGEEVRIEIIADRVFGSNLDSILYVIDEDGETTLATNDDFFDGSRDSFIRFVAPVAGNRVYFIGVTDFGGFGGDTFPYVLNLTIADAPDRVEVEPNDTTGNADEVPIPAFYFGEVDINEDLDVYFFEGFSGEALIIDIDAELFFSEMDPVVEIYDDTGGYLFGVDDADGLDPRFNIVLPYTGLYFIAVYDARGLGSSASSYTMNVSVQSGALAPRVTAFKFINFTVLKQVRGLGFVSSGDGAYAELNSQEIRSFNAPRKPSTAIKVKPGVETEDGDVITVVNPDGRRSNPGIVD